MVKKYHTLILQTALCSSKKENNHNGYDYIYVNKYTIRMESSIKKF